MLLLLLRILRIVEVLNLLLLFSLGFYLCEALFEDFNEFRIDDQSDVFINENLRRNNYIDMDD